jgi:hypothetical protein
VAGRRLRPLGNILLSRVIRADVRLVGAEFGIGFKESWERALRDIEDAGEHRLSPAQLEGFLRRDGGRRGGLLVDELRYLAGAIPSRSRSATSRHPRRRRGSCVIPVTGLT